MVRFKFSVLFYSKSKNLILAQNIKQTLSEFKSCLINTFEIDEVLLKKYSRIDVLILDFTKEILDDRSLVLLTKLLEQGYIKNILSIKGDIGPKTNFFAIKNDEDFFENLKNYFTNIISQTNLSKYETQNLCYQKLFGDFLLDYGFSMKQKGFSMIVDALSFLFSKDCTDKNMNKGVYLLLANKYQTSVSNVEGNIRKGISTAYNKHEKLPFSYCPTNKEFIKHCYTELYNKIYQIKL